VRKLQATLKNRLEERTVGAGSVTERDVFEGLRDVSMIKRPAKRPRKPKDNKRENKSVVAVRQGFSNR
jgi:hypothetical protein